jgi:hypothetical protein
MAVQGNQLAAMGHAERSGAHRRLRFPKGDEVEHEYATELLDH